ncbi:MAG: hypothetical protein ACXWIS_18695 [Burkholderiales bacterium]
MLRHRKRRRMVGVALVVVGALLMWLAPRTVFTSQAATGFVLLLAGILLELNGITLEHRDNRKP